MKKVILLAVALLSVSVASAQKSTPWFLGGSLNGGVQRADKTFNITNVNIAPQIGYMFNDNWGMALDLNFGRANKNNTMGGGLSGFYLMKITDKFFYVPTLRLGADMWNNKNFPVGKGMEFGARLDFLKFELRPSCHWAFTFGFGAADVNFRKPKGGDSTITALGNVGETLVGFKFYF